VTLAGTAVWYRMFKSVIGPVLGTSRVIEASVKHHLRSSGRPFRLDLTKWGCVYTAQGFEYDWSGVILGPDLVWRDGRFTSVRSANKDPEFRNHKKVSDGDFDRLVRNVYKVLLTRGMVGTVVYSTDLTTREALRHLVREPVAAPGARR
jgi:Uncharacterized conserved protein (DUF2075)